MSEAPFLAHLIFPAYGPGSLGGLKVAEPLSRIPTIQPRTSSGVQALNCLTFGRLSATLTLKPPDVVGPNVSVPGLLPPQRAVCPRPTCQSSARPRKWISWARRCVTSRNTGSSGSKRRTGSAGEADSKAAGGWLGVLPDPKCPDTKMHLRPQEGVVQRQVIPCQRIREITLLGGSDDPTEEEHVGKA